MPCPAVWLVYEQVAMAALDCSLLPLAAGLIRALSKRFPDSLRAKRIQVGVVAL